MTQLKNNRKNSGYLIASANFALLGLLAYFAWTTVYSGDDYWYSTFWDNGLKSYLELMAYHYREFNGRTLVHMFVHVVLHFDNWAFMLVCCGVCMTAILVACRVAYVQKERLGAATAIYLAGILVMPTSFFMDGMMWISAFFNYMFPVALCCILLMAQEMRWPRVLLYVLTFLCGATTEQMGLTAVVITLVYTIDAVLRKQGGGYCLPAVGAAIAGVLSIFLSPATLSRVSPNLAMENLAQIIQDILATIAQSAQLLTENPFPVLLMLAFFLLSGLWLWKNNRKRMQICIIAADAAALVMGSFADGGLQIAGFVVTFVALFYLSVELVLHGERVCGVLMIAALTSAAVMLPINSLAPRTMVPVYVLMLLSVSVLGAKLDTKGYMSGAAVWAIVGIAVVYLIPSIKGYWYNYQVDQLNKSFIEEDRDAAILRYCPDYDYDYTWNGKVHLNSAYRQFYLQTNDMPEDTVVFFFSGDYDPPRIICEDEQLDAYAAISDGAYYLPIRIIIEHYGGTLDWSPEATVIKMGGITYHLSIDGETGVLRWTDPEGRYHEAEYPCMKYYTLTCCDQELLSNILGVVIHFEQDSNCFRITS